MKRMISLLLAFLMALSVCGGALALNYSGNLGNEATFETMAEVKVNAPIAMQEYGRGGNMALLRQRGLRRLGKGFFQAADQSVDALAGSDADRYRTGTQRRSADRSHLQH